MTDAAAGQRATGAALDAVRSSACSTVPFNWGDCLSLHTAELSKQITSLWVLVFELDSGRCRTIGAHQLSTLLENLAPLGHRTLLDNVGCHFVERLLSYGREACWILKACQGLSSAACFCISALGCTFEQCVLIFVPLQLHLLAGLSADYLNATSVLSRPLICWFAAHGCARTCGKLLAANVNPDIRELNFEAGNPTALLLAARGGFPDCVQALIAAGADIQLADDFGSTAFHEAAGSTDSGDHTQAAVLLHILQHPAGHHLLHRANAADVSPVSRAAAAGNTACIKLLLKASHPELKQRLALQALSAAAEANSTEAIELLTAEADGSASQTCALQVCCALCKQHVMHSALLPCKGAWHVGSRQYNSCCAQVATRHGRAGCLALMLRACPQQCDLDDAVLAAADCGHEHALQMVLQAGELMHMTRISGTGVSC